MTSPDEQPTTAPTDLLGMKVSALLAACPDALEVLVAHGFTPLKQPHLRALLAPTVTLSQALRLRSLSAAAERALLDELTTLFASRQVEVAR